MHTKSAAKRAKQNERRRLSNRSARGVIITARRKFFEACEGKDKAKAMELFSAYASELDRAARKGVILANNASRRKSRASARLALIDKV